VAESGDTAEYEANHSGIGADIKLAENNPNAPADFPTTDRDQEVEAPAKPKRESAVKRKPSQPSTTVAFPGSGDTESRDTPSIANGSRPQSPGVTFEPQSPPPRNETPDPDAEPRRKRTASQNFQRLGRRISIGTRRAGSALSIPIQNIPGIPGFKREGTSTPVNKDEPVTDAPATGSPSPSLNDAAKAKKMKKEKRKTLG